MAKFVRDFRDELARRRVFYHDADIVFPRALPRVLREAAFPDRRARTATQYTRGDGGVVYEYYAREDAQSETVCGARCFVRERFTHVNITDVALEGTTESTRREAPGVAEREGPCAALCPGG